MKQQLALTLMLIALVACGPAPAPTPDLANSRWKLADIDGTPIDASVEATLQFDDQNVSGRGGCNQYGGKYTLDGSQITFSDLAWTDMACQDPAMSTEFSFLSALESGGTIVNIDGAIELNSVDGTILRFTAQ